MAEVEQPSLDSEQEQHTEPLSPAEVEQLRSGSSGLEPVPKPTYSEQRQRFIDQATGYLLNRAAKADVAAETLSHGADDLGGAHQLNAQLKREEAESLRQQAAQAATDAGTQFDTEQPLA